MTPKPKYQIGIDEAARIPLPRNLSEALAHPQWRASIIKEINSIVENKTFDIRNKDNKIDAGKPLRTHFVFRAKPNADGTLLKLKSRLVANGNNQEEGINYFASYAPVAGASTIKAQVVHGKLNEHIMESWDYSSAYLQATLEENIEVRLPGDPNEYGLSIPRGSQIKLSKSIYGLVQAGNACNKLLTESLTRAGFKQSDYVPC